MVLSQNNCLVSLVLWAAMVSITRGQDAVFEPPLNPVNFTCTATWDYGPKGTCPKEKIGDGECDNPNHGGEDENCAGQDCIDCNKFCKAFDADCFGCLNAVGCYYCPGEGTCQNSNLYKSDNKDLICTRQNDFWKGGRDDPNVKCIGPKSPTLDPLASANEWAFEMIRVNEVWPTYTGTGVVIRINDDGVDVDNLDFKDRFSLEGSCSTYLPIDEPGNDHGTKVAGILAGNRDNKHCAVGIAYGSTFSSCNVFERGINFGQLNEKLDTFDISQNSIGLPACKGPPTRRELQSADCPFNVEQPEDGSKPQHDPCAVCDFTNVDKECEDEITDYCKYNFRRDEANCVDFLEYIIQGPCNYDRLPQSAITGLQEGVTQGRDGKGIIYVFASGNAWWQGEDINMSRWTNSRYTITVGAVGKDGLHTDYSTPGAALTVTGPVGDFRDVSQLMTTDIGGGCTNSGVGTSYSAPVVSAVIALILEANPNLGWRDVQGILAVTSTNVADPSDRTATTNAAGIWHSNLYGFGIIDAKRGVDTALKWQNWTPEYQAIGESEEENAAIPNDGTEYVSTLTVSNDYRGFSSESVSILLNLQHYNRGDLELRLVAPTGTESILHPGKRDEGELLQGDERWKLSTLKNWGEDPSGVWTLKIRDLVTDNTDLTEENVLRQWKLVAYGRTKDGLPPTLTGNTNAPTVTPSDLEEGTPAPIVPTTAAPTNVPTTAAPVEPTLPPTSVKPTFLMVRTGPSVVSLPGNTPRGSMDIPIVTQTRPPPRTTTITTTTTTTVTTRPPPRSAPRPTPMATNTIIRPQYLSGQTAGSTVTRSSTTSFQRFGVVDESLEVELGEDEQIMDQYLQVELVENLSLRFNGVGELKNDMKESIQMALEEHTRSVIAKLLPGLHFKNQIRIATVESNKEEGGNGLRRTLEPDDITPKITIVYDELVQFDHVTGTNDLNAAKLASLAFKSSDDRKAFVNLLKKNFEGFESLESVSILQLPPTDPPVEMPTEVPGVAGTNARVPSSNTVFSQKITGKESEDLSETTENESVDLSEEATGMEVEEGSGVYASQPLSNSALNATVAVYSVVVVGVLIISGYMIFRRRC